jgi:cysteinyl-tRNA synthetase
LAALAVEVDERFHAAMDDDFDTAVAVAALFDLGRAINRARGERQPAAAIEPARGKLVELAAVLGLELETAEAAGIGDAAPFIDLLVEVRNELRAAKQWALSDRIRDGLSALGIVVEDTATGSTWERRKA